ncbi:MAG TPA: nucleoside-diphosphate sugar epimerase/dehydratase [Gemmatimonadota bacterium]|nr:nucleoside-diphosphate sugar epimerase/dehydratase [Gemmatimonadota bacterium]
MTHLVYRHRRVVTTATNLVLFAAAYFGSFLIRFEFNIPAQQTKVFWTTLPAIVLIQTAVFGFLRLHQGLWRYVSVADLKSILAAAALSAVTYSAIAFFWLPARVTPRSIILLDFLLTVMLVGGARFLVRIVRERYRPQLGEDTRRVIIVGAGAAGAQTLREIMSNPRLRIHPIGFVDDDPYKRNGCIHGFRVLGTTEEIEALLQRHAVDEILIALPSATGGQIRRIVERCEAVNVSFKVLPAAADLIDGRVSVRQFRDVQIEDLLGREHVQLDVSRIGQEIAGQTVLITGAGGSIGSELARQVRRFEPEKLLLLDRGENALFYIHSELADFERVVPIVGDIQDAALLDEVFQRWRPSVVYHAAAYKHVPLMEVSVLEAVRNNVLGTRTLMDAARKYRTERFVLISTDKAVRPRNVMGATKRLAEMLMLDRNGHGEGGTKFVAVRFGNVLGSEGSVLPIFRRQLMAGGPLTVTDPEASRYFMTIPEAVQLVMQAGSMGEGGEVYILEMGEPVRIEDLAKRLITLAGKTPHEDIDIVFTGLRPGEKLHEELYGDEEPVLPTSHDKILILSGLSVPRGRLQASLAELERSLAARDEEALYRALMEAVLSSTEPIRRTGS